MVTVDVSLLGAGALTLAIADEEVTAYAAAESIASRLRLAPADGFYALCVATDGELGFDRLPHGAAMLDVVAGLRRDASGAAQRLVFWRALALAPPPPPAAVPPNPCDAAELAGGAAHDLLFAYAERFFLHGHARLQGARFVIEARMDHSAVMARLVLCDGLLFFN